MLPSATGAEAVGRLLVHDEERAEGAATALGLFLEAGEREGAQLKGEVEPLGRGP